MADGYVQKNIVICLDGTGNQIEADVSNVLKFYRCLDKNGRGDTGQVVYYDQGVGTLGLSRAWTGVSQSARKLLGLVTGYGLDDQVLGAYRFLIQQYAEGRPSRSSMTSEPEGDEDRLGLQRDRIFIFGYSRGAYSARVLAALIHNLGVLSVEQAHLAPAALTAYKRLHSETDLDQVGEFNRITQPRRPPIYFLGLWDTVASMIVPRRDRLYFPSLQELWETRRNPGVATFREAASIDEARRMFRLEPWEEGQTFQRSPWSSSKRPQDAQRVWFPGHHGDVGGGNPREASGLSQYPLCWMIGEAHEAGAIFNRNTVNYVALGGDWAGRARYRYPEPDPSAPAHDSKATPWALLEYLPGRVQRREWKGRRSFFGLYSPRWEPRVIAESGAVHAVAQQRSQTTPSYAPRNLPPTHRITGSVEAPLGPFHQP